MDTEKIVDDIVSILQSTFKENIENCYAIRLVEHTKNDLDSS